jgi:hypothetical protein
VDKHTVHFLSDGRIQRISSSQGTNHLLFKFKAKDNQLYLETEDKSDYLPAGNLRDDGCLVLDLKERIFLYKPLPPGTQTEDFDLEGNLDIQFRKEL